MVVIKIKDSTSDLDEVYSNNSDLVKGCISQANFESDYTLYTVSKLIPENDQIVVSKKLIVVPEKDISCYRFPQSWWLGEYVEKNSDIEYTDNPDLDDPNDIFYIGTGCDWDVDKNGRRYWKRYHMGIIKSIFKDNTKYDNLQHGDIINERARIEGYIKDYLKKSG